MTTRTVSGPSSGLICVTATRIATPPKARHSTGRIRSRDLRQWETEHPLCTLDQRRQKQTGRGRATLPTSERGLSRTSHRGIMWAVLIARSHTRLRQGSRRAPAQTASMITDVRRLAMAGLVRVVAPSIRAAHPSGRQSRPTSTRTAFSRRCRHSKVSTVSITPWLSPWVTGLSRLSPPLPYHPPTSRTHLAKENSNTSRLWQATTRKMASSQQEN